MCAMESDAMLGAVLVLVLWCCGAAAVLLWCCGAVVLLRCCCCCSCGCGDGGGRCRAGSKCFLLTLEISCRVCLFVSLVYLVFFFVR